MSAATNQRPIIIKKIKKISGGGHHGGAWKVAYADFVTAMMAFFLLMWLINTTSPEQKRGIAEFFAPASVSRAASGAGGLLAGRVSPKKACATAVQRRSAQSNRSRKTPPTPPMRTPRKAKPPPAANKAPTKTRSTARRALRENAEFSRAEIAIRQAMQDMPDVAELSRNVIMEQTPEGLRIQIVDQEGRSMFNPGDAQPNERARRLLVAMSGVIEQLPNRVTISGHTDGNAPGGRYASNFELSAERANSARRILMAQGLPANRIYQVAGRADSEPCSPTILPCQATAASPSPCCAKRPRYQPTWGYSQGEVLNR